MLGKALMRQWSGDDVTGLGSAQADIRSPDQVDKVVADSNPEWIVLSAAYTDVDGCEINPTLAAAVNTHGRGECGQGGCELAREAFICQHRLRFRWHEKYALRGQ